MVIDDDPAFSEIVSNALRGHGYQLVIAFNIEDALVDFDKYDYALIMVDIFMSGMGGIEGIRKIRELRPDMKIIAISGGYAGMSSEDTLNAAGKIGADAIMAKPISISELRETVARFVES